MKQLTDIMNTLEQVDISILEQGNLDSVFRNLELISEISEMVAKVENLLLMVCQRLQAEQDPYRVKQKAKVFATPEEIHTLYKLISTNR